ncbi:MAG: hypothetical protein IJA12_00700 [Oscillospiraceae bacterium]|nr:hypothetical protein [Oscillospiraceae bacterium]
MNEEVMTEEKTEQAETVEADGLVEIVREKHEMKDKTEQMTDIFTTQLILTVLLVLVFAVMHIFNTDLAEWFINRFKEKSMGETEKIIKDAVSYAVNIIR